MIHPYLDKAFKINWQALKTECVIPDIQKSLEDAQANLDAIAKTPLDTVDFDNTILALERATYELDDAWGKVAHLDSVCNGPELREVYNEMLPKVSEFYTGIVLNEDLWKRVKAFAQKDAAKSLEGIQKRLFEETFRDFQESGADLDKKKKAELEAINAELAKLTQKYSENVLDATNVWSLVIDDESKLAGLPESAKEAARLDALAHQEGSEESPKWRFNLQAPSMIPVMQYLDDAGIREQVWRASSAVGQDKPYDNTDLIKGILKLRHEKAGLLGHENFADLTLKRRMAKTGAKALEFIEDLHGRIELIFKEEVVSVEKFKAKKTENPVEKLQPWEFGYWAEKMRKELYDFDEEALRPYFPIDPVVEGMFKLVESLYGIEVREEALSDAQKWHPEVKFYAVYDSKKKHLGSFYSDWHPRPTKRGGAWMNHLHTGEQGKPHLGLICGNMTPSLDGKPALLNHSEVETIFHEFGHLLHHILSEVGVKSLHGTSVAWDFVELPSQIMENWCWERESLDLFASHYKTGEKIPEKLFQKMLATRNYLSAVSTMRQLSISKMDLDLHIHYERYCNEDLDKVLDEILKGYVVQYKTKAPTLVRRIGHIFSDPTGYAAGYYSYKWAEVLDADAFTRFKKEGLTSRVVGMDFWKKILSQGNSRPADELFYEFMGREPELNALLERSGLIRAS